MSFSAPDLLSWRQTAEISDGTKVYAGVMVVPSAAMARSLMASVPDITVPELLLRALDADPDAGVTAALDMIEAIEASGAFDGVHLVPVSRYRQVAAQLEARR